MARNLSFHKIKKVNQKKICLQSWLFDERYPRETRLHSHSTAQPEEVTKHSL